MLRNDYFCDRSCKNDESGFSLLEVLIVISLIGLATSAVYSTYQSQLKLFVTQNQVRDMQQSLRGLLDILAFDIRMVGYEQKEGANAGFINPSGISFSTVAMKDEIRFTSDLAVCATSNGCHPGVIDQKEAELIGYKLDNNVIRRFSPGSVSWQPLAENIEALNFVYLDKDRNRLGDINGNITDPVDLDKVRSIQITIVARSSEKASVLSFNQADKRAFSNLQGDIIVTPQKDNIRRIAISTEVRLRNWRI